MQNLDRKLLELRESFLFRWRCNFSIDQSMTLLCHNSLVICKLRFFVSHIQGYGISKMYITTWDFLLKKLNAFRLMLHQKQFLLEFLLGLVSIFICQRVTFCKRSSKTDGTRSIHDQSEMAAVVQTFCFCCVMKLYTRPRGQTRIRTKFSIRTLKIKQIQLIDSLIL